MTKHSDCLLLATTCKRIAALIAINLSLCIKKMLAIALSISLIITPQITLAANILINSGLKHFEMDLGSALMTIDNIDSRLQLTLDPKGALNVSSFHAKRITLHIKTVVDANEPKERDLGVLPDKINLPFPIALQAGVVDELVIVRGTQKDVLQNIRFNLNADTNNLALALSVESSPWGKLNSKLSIENQHPFKLAGAIHLNQVAGNVPYQLRADLSGSLQSLRFETNNVLNYENNQFFLTLLPMQENNIKHTLISTQGSLSLEGSYPLSFQMAIKDLNPAYIHPQLAGVVNLDLSAFGALAPNSELMVSFKATDSMLRQQALMLNAEASVFNGQLKKLSAHGKLATNSFEVTDNGASSLQWQADFNDIRVLGNGFAGELFAKGTASSIEDHSTYQYEMTANKLRLPDNMRINKLTTKGEFSTAENGLLSNETVLEGFTQDNPDEINFKLINTKLSLTGTQKAHRLTIDIDNHSNDVEKVIGIQSLVTGGFTADGWRGSIEKLMSLDQKSILLRAPSPVRYSQVNGFGMQNFQLQINQGLLAIDTLALNQTSPAPYQLKSTGRMELIALQDIQDYLFIHSSKIKNDLVVNGQWNVLVNDVVNADIAFRRESGDVRIYNNENTAEKMMDLGLTTVLARINITNNAVVAETEISGTKSGFLRGKLNTQLTRMHNSIGLAKAAPLSVVLDANLKTLAWLPLAEVYENTELDGTLAIALKANGTLAAPNFSGSLNGNNLKLDSPNLGVALNNGLLQAQLSDQLLTIQQLTFNGGEGTVKVTGDARYSKGQPVLNLLLQADNFTALSRTDRLIVLNGNGDINFNNNQISLNGKFNVLHGLFELPKQGVPKLDADVVIIGSEISEVPPQVAVNIGALSIDFGEKPATPFNSTQEFMIRGSGINAALSGVIKLSGKTSEQLNANGSLELTGTYLAYGQLLDIEAGRINFSGPMTNAGLNITAMRNLQPTKAGVRIAGTVLTPTVTLISDPEVSESDKLSLLVIGQPMSQAGDSELALLSLAAGALLSDGESIPLQTRIANTAGLDSLNITGSDASTYSINVGKRISNNLYLGYEKSLFGLLNVAKLTYKLTQRISIETRAGSDSAVDLLYSFNFD